MTSSTFDSPKLPLIETVLGVQFDSIPGLRNAHLGSFWKRLGSDWPNVRDAPPLASQFERFGVDDTWDQASSSLGSSQELSTRVQILNSSNDRMIQVQNRRFHYNWLGSEGATYPRYATVLVEFEKRLSEFELFLKESKLGEVCPNQWEITYVNHFPKSSYWTDVQNWCNLFGIQAIQSDPTRRTTRLEGVGGEWHYEIEPKRGRLHVQLKHGQVAQNPSDEVILLLFTARGSIGKDTATIDAGLNLGHEVIVNTFSEVFQQTPPNRSAP